MPASEYFNSDVVVDGELLSTGTVAAWALARRDTSAKAWVVYSAAGNFQLYNNAGGAEPFIVETGALTNTLVLSASGVAISGALSAGQTVVQSDSLAQFTVKRGTAGNVRQDIIRPSLTTEVAQLAFGTAAALDYQIGLIGDVNLRIRNVSSLKGIYIDPAGTTFAENGLSVTSSLGATGLISGNIAVGSTALQIHPAAAGRPTHSGSIVITEYSATLAATMGIEFQGRADGAGYGQRISNLSNNNDLVFEDRSNSATWTERFRLLNGVGAAITGALSATGDISAPSGRFLLNPNNTGLTYGGADTGQVIIKGGGTTAATFGANAITFATGLVVTGSLSSTLGANFATASGSVGVRLSDPRSNLEVLQNGIWPGIYIRENSGSQRRATIGFGLNAGSATTGWILGQSLGNDTTKDFYLVDVSAGQVRLYINTSGNVGIGAAAPAEKLHVQGHARFGRPSDDTRYWDIRAADGAFRHVQSGIVEIQLGFTGGNSWIGATSGVDGAGAQWFLNGSNGSVLIGRTVATLGGGNGGALQIGSGSSASGLTIHSSTTGTGDIQFADGITGADSYRGLIRYEHATDLMSIWTNGSSRVTISSVGRVDIASNVESIYLTHTSNAYSASALNNGQLTFGGGNAVNSARGMRFRNTSGNGESWFGTVQNAAGREVFRWQGWDGSAYTEWMQIYNGSLTVFGPISGYATGDTLNGTTSSFFAGNYFRFGGLGPRRVQLHHDYTSGGDVLDASDFILYGDLDAATGASPKLGSVDFKINYYDDSITTTYNYTPLALQGPNVVMFGTALGKTISGEGVLFLLNRTVNPSANPSGGGYMYVESGALKYRGSSGTTTTIANA